MVLHYSNIRTSKFEFFQIFRIIANHGRMNDHRGTRFHMDNSTIWIFEIRSLNFMKKVYHYSNIRNSKFEFFRIFRIIANHGRMNDHRGTRFHMDNSLTIKKVFHYSNRNSKVKVRFFLFFLVFTHLPDLWIFPDFLNFPKKFQIFKTFQ